MPVYRYSMIFKDTPMLEIEVDFVDTLIDIDRKLTVKGAPAQAVWTSGIDGCCARCW